MDFFPNSSKYLKNCDLNINISINKTFQEFQEFWRERGGETSEIFLKTIPVFITLRVRKPLPSLITISPVSKFAQT